MNRRILENMVLVEAMYIKDTDATVRAVAKQFNISKSSVSRHMNVILPRVSPPLAQEIHSIFKQHIIEGRKKGGRYSHGHKEDL